MKKGVEVVPDPWQLRLRGAPLGGGGGIVLDLPSGGRTTLQELIRLSSKASKIPQRRLVIRYGFPPKTIAEESLAEKNTLHIQSAGIQNKDTLHIARGELASAHAAESAQGNQTASTSNQQKPQSVTPTKRPNNTRVVIDKTGAVKFRKIPQKRKKRVKMPPSGSGHLLGHSMNEDFVLGRAESSHDAAVARIGADLTAAGRGSQSQDMLQSSVLKSLRKSFRAAYKQHEQWVEAGDKVAAAMAGRVRFEPVADQSGRMRCIYTKPSGRKEKEDCVLDIPAFLLKAILKQIAKDDDPVQLENLQPQNMALVSLRTFWSLVKHAGFSNSKNNSFTAALQELVPEVNWVEIIEQRKRKKPEKYGDYVSH